MGDSKVAVISANLGGFDPSVEHVAQSVPYDSFMFTDENFPPRSKAMTPRLQAKIPKCFGWQMAPGYDYYLWIDGNLAMTHPDTLQYFLDYLKDSDFVALRHPRRDTVEWEGRYLARGLKDQSRYMVNRYEGEFVAEQMEAIRSDAFFQDDLLVAGGIFAYRNTDKVQEMLKEWWYHISRYLVMDQCSLSYLLSAGALRVEVLPDVYNDCKWISHRGHVRHG